MSKLGKKLRSKPVELVLIAIFLLYSLRVINWFEYPHIMVSGDFRPPFSSKAFMNRVLYTWDEMDFGIPSVYSPRVLDPFYFLTIAFESLGAGLFLSQVVTVFLMYFLASILMFILIRRITKGDIKASFVATLYLTSNLYLINDREVTAIGFIEAALMILPFLIVFAEGIIRKSYKLMALSGPLFVLTYGLFPNFRAALLCLITSVLILLFIYINDGVKILIQKTKASRFLNLSLNLNLVKTHLKYLLVLVVSVLFASTWIFMIVYANFDSFFLAYKQMEVPPSIIDIQPHDVLRLIAKWGFYSSYGGDPYVPYASTYLHDPLIIVLSYLPPILAFASLLLSKSRKLTIYFGFIGAFFLALMGGLNPFFSQLYLGLASYVPLMLAFRESAQWSFIVVFSFSLLIGTTLSALCQKLKRKSLQALVLGLAVILFLSSSYPLTTGDVARNYQKTSTKGSVFPQSYIELDGMLSSRNWALMLPQRDLYVGYSFNGIPFGSGNPYPLIFSKPIITGIGTEYVGPADPSLIYTIHDLIRMLNNSDPVILGGVPKFLGMLGIRQLVFEKNFTIGARDFNSSVLYQNNNFVLVKDWDEVALFENTCALEKMYMADNLLSFATRDGMYKSVEDSEWSALNHSVFINATSMNGIVNRALMMPDSFVWKQLSPTSYEANAYSRGAFFLVLSETYDPHWKLSVNGNTLSEMNHLEVNTFANGWLIEDTGNLMVTIEYETQKLFTASVVASILLPALLIAFLCRADLKALSIFISHKLKRKTPEN